MLLCFTTPLFSQTTGITLIDINDINAESAVRSNLPPLDYFLSGIKENPRSLFYEEKLKEEEQNLKIIKKNWLTYIRVSGNGQYGFTNDLTTVTEISAPITSRYYGKTQFYYGAGMTLSLPLSTIFDRTNRIKSQKAKANASEYEAELWREEIASKIIDCYTKASESLYILKATSGSVNLSNAQYKIAELDFASGRLDMKSLGMQKEIHTRAIVDFERARSALNNALLKLELISKKKIVK